MQNVEVRSGVVKPVECFKEGWELIKDEYWLLFAVTLVGALIGGMTMYILFGAMICGIFYAYLRKIDGGRVVFDDLWKGFTWWGAGLVVTLFIIVPMIAVYLIIYLPFIMAAVMGSKLSQDEMMGMLIGAAAVDLVLIVLMVCVHTLMMFSFPLIVDRGLGPFKAMGTSARAVLRNLGGVTGLLLLNFGIVILGQLALCVGVYFVIPIVMAGNVVAYRKIFPPLHPTNYAPPPPSTYQGFQ
jgi:hypothetical protein